ncbi:AdeC/AdeK/OprM family multidrug efflux complex outer membrane factor [Flavobacteriaceae bacterium GF1]
MKLQHYIGLFLVFSFTKVPTLSAQDRPQENLSLEQAIALALENNQALRIEQKRVEISNERNRLGNAGLLPTISLIGDANYTNNATDLTIRTFQPNPPVVSFDEDGVASTTLQGTAQLDYTVFAGFSGKYRFKLLQNENKVANLQQRATINGTILSVSTLFLEIAKLQRREELLLETLEITKERITRIKDRKSFGKATGLDILNAETDLNRDRTTLDNVLLAKNTLKRDLNFLIGYEAERRYWVTAIYTAMEISSLEDIKLEVLANNPNLLLAREGVQISENQIGLAKSRSLPRIGVFANYGYFFQENDVQQLAEITNLGYTVGGRITMDIFNGGQNKSEVRTAKLEREAILLEKEQLEDRLVTDAVTQVNRINIIEDQLERERLNLDTFQEAYERTEERFKNGKATNLDVRDAQTSLLNAQISVVELQADLMIAHISLRNLIGKI